ncbi:MAG: hypothetical protein GY856_54400 [bacterium]|nr:hypothetical protein [bacterium]
MCAYHDEDVCSMADQAAQRITLMDPVPGGLQPGTLVEIDLLGDGQVRFYATLLLSASGNDIASVITAAEILERCLEEVQGRSCHSPADTKHWEAFARRLFEIQELVSISDHRSTGALIWLLEKLRIAVLSALRDDLHHTDSTWSLIESLLERALGWCQELAEDAAASVVRQQETNTTPTYSPLSTSWHIIINNPVEFTTGIHLAARLSLDLNTLQVGHCLNGDAVATLRGYKL